VEEAWQHKHPETSIHTQEFLPVPKEWFNDALAQQWDVLKDVRRVVMGALEVERAAGRIGSSLQAYPTIWVKEESTYALIKDVDLAELCITSDAKAIYMAAPENAFAIDDIPGLYVTVESAHGEKCARCWRVLPEVAKEKAHASVCVRCDHALS
jgi:isoleucyl-tRNA synthetase